MPDTNIYLKNIVDTENNLIASAGNYQNAIISNNNNIGTPINVLDDNIYYGVNNKYYDKNTELYTYLTPTFEGMNLVSEVSATNSIIVNENVSASSTGTPTSGFGIGKAYWLDNGVGYMIEAANMNVSWYDYNASEINFYTTYSTGSVLGLNIKNSSVYIPGDLTVSGTIYSTNVIGASGYSGYSGKSGYSGYSGLNGSASASGYSGYSGSNGSNGSTGTSGYSGYSGSSFVASTWVDYTASADIYGWESSPINKEVRYMKNGNIISCAFFISGTSNDTNAYFRLPVTWQAVSISNNILWMPARIQNNSTSATTGLLRLGENGDTVGFSTNLDGGFFETSGIKVVKGFFTHITT